jgi:hypothetical protein
MTNNRLSRIEKQISDIKEQLMAIGEMRPGSLTRQYKNPLNRTGGFYQLSYTHKSKSKTEYVRPNHLDDLKKQINTYRKFKKLTERWVQLSIQRSILKMDISDQGRLK